MDNNFLKILEFVKTKKTKFVKAIDISKVSSVVDYFLIISMDNFRSVESIKDDIVDFINKEKINIKHIEGEKTPWIIIDCFDYCIHIFREQEREYYNLEKNWADGIDVTFNIL